MPRNDFSNSNETRQNPTGSAPPPPAGPPPRSIFENDTRSMPSGNATEKK